MELILPDGTHLPRQVMPTRSYLSQSELPITFGLGKQDQVERLVIRWPDGSEQEVRDIALDRTLVIEQNGGSSSGQVAPGTVEQPATN